MAEKYPKPSDESQDWVIDMMKARAACSKPAGDGQRPYGQKPPANVVGRD